MKSKLSFYSKFCIIALKTHYYALHPYYFKSPHVKTVNLEKPLETSRVSFALRHEPKKLGPCIFSGNGGTEERLNTTTTCEILQFLY